MKLRYAISQLILFSLFSTSSFASSGIPDGVYTRYYMPVAAGVSSFTGQLTVPKYTPNTYSSQVNGVLELREAPTGSGPSGHNYRVGIQFYPTYYNTYQANAFWTNNNGAGAASQQIFANPGDQLAVQIVYSPSTSSYTTTLTNLSSGATKTLVWGTSACPAQIMKAVEFKIMTQGLVNCDYWNPSLIFQAQASSLIDMNMKSLIWNPSFEQVQSPVCSASPYQNFSGGIVTLGK